MSMSARAFAVLGVVALEACAAGAQPAATLGARSNAELEATYRARADSALARYTAADTDFMTRMIGHHAQAVTMASLAPGRSARADVRLLASRITTAQEAEIGLMGRWLEDRGLDVPEWPSGASAGAVQHSAGVHGAPAPGMLSREQMLELERASGGNFDGLFLLYMTQHHRGAVAMVDELFATAGAAADASTFRIASGIQADQRAEIARMEALAATPGAGRTR
jgi:uncharacterized protein (DUF305 family)